METVNLQLVDIAFDRTDGFSFEKFCHALFSALTTSKFIPLGGTGDGGADGFSETISFENERSTHFWQFSIQSDHREKIRDTIKSLRKVGREVQQLTYCTARSISKLDIEEDILSNELNVRIRIRDRRYLGPRINESAATIEAFRSYLSPTLAFLREIGGATTIATIPDMPSRTLCVFLGQELEQRRGNTQLLEAVTDSLILWALEGTDPDKGIFSTRTEILQRIEAALPSAKHFIRGILDRRLEILSSAGAKNDRQIRHYKKENKFCLPFETRMLVQKENETDEILKADVSEEFRLRATVLSGDVHEGSNFITMVVDLCHRTLQITFEKQGLELSYYVLESATEHPGQGSISENVEQALEEFDVSGKMRSDMKSVALRILRKTFYDSSYAERLYLSKLSRTYTLLFVLKNEPKIVEYFRGMSAELNLYVGADLIIRALSEHYLPEKDKMTANMFAILRRAGSELVLTEKTLDEIWTHIIRDDREFKNRYSIFESEISIEFASHINRIIIRSYFYSRLDPDPKIRRPASWSEFIDQFCDYERLHDSYGRELLKNYLCEKFGFSYETAKTTTADLDEDEIDALKRKLLDIRTFKRVRDKEELLAENDAIQVLRIYQRRDELGESSRSNPYGFRTWWLTQESMIVTATADLVKRRSSRYMMRPEFLLNFIALAPGSEEVRKSFDTIFPSLLGVKLSNRLKPDVLKKVMERVKRVYSTDEAKARAEVRQLSDLLKGDNYKEYEINFT